MNKKIIHNLEDLTYYLTIEEQCSYLEGQIERKIFTKLDNDRSQYYFDMLSQRGFRRSQNVAYIPACKTCNACRSSRINVVKFKASKSQKRVINKNQFIHRQIVEPMPTKAQYKLFEKYINARHAKGEMSEMTVVDFAKMITETNVNTKIFEYYMQDEVTGAKKLIAAGLTDFMSDGLSMVYSFFDPELGQNSIGKFIILDHIAYAASQNMPYIYLGFYIENSDKMAYKKEFLPQQHFTGSEWENAE